MTATTATGARPGRLDLAGYLACFNGIVWREVLRFLHQRERFLAALVRPLVWLFIFAAGFRQVLGVSIIPPYETYVLYEVFVTPGLVAMVLLFNAMQTSLSMVHDRETGTMRTLLVSPFPRSFLLLSKLMGGVAVALEGHAHLAHVSHVAELGHREPHPRRLEVARDHAAHVLGERFQQLEAALREIALDALDHLAVVHRVVDVVGAPHGIAGDADVDLHLERLGTLLFPLVDAHPRIDAELADEDRIHGAVL